MFQDNLSQRTFENVLQQSPTLGEWSLPLSMTFKDSVILWRARVFSVHPSGVMGSFSPLGGCE